MNWKQMEAPTYWQRQASNKPLFPDLHWAKPETKQTAGKLLIIGGNSHGLTAPGTAFAAAIKAGIGTSHVLLPDAIRKAIGNSFSEGDFVASTPSGSFSKDALNQILENSLWSDGVLLAGDFGKNSETAILLQEYAKKYVGPLTITHDGLDYFIKTIDELTHRPDTLIITNLAKLQKITTAGMPSLIIQHSMSLHALVGLLNSWTRETGAKILTYHNNNFIYADAGQVSTTLADEKINWEVPLGAYAATWWAQHPTKSFESITTAIYDFIN